MRLFIAEKPSLARAIAEALPGPRKRSATSIECADGNVVVWCAGHILQTAPPEGYSDAYKHWRLEDLPIVPTEWKLDVSTPELLKSIKTWLKRATRIVHAGDPDREGQLLVDEVLHYLGCKLPVDRLLVRDLSPEAVRKSLEELKPNSTFRGLSDSALARQRADWLYGMNMTRLYTLLGRSGGYDGVLSVGRVQTPLLGLIVARDLAIENFTPVPYYAMAATMKAPDGCSFRAVWQPGPSAQEHLDPEQRLLSREVAEQVRSRCQGQPATVIQYKEETKSGPPPLPFSLADLQVEAGRRFGMSAQAVLDAGQSLYEQHRLLTYPRSDCAHLPEGQFGHAPQLLAAVAKQAPALEPLLAKTDLSIRSKAWNDKKVTAHHAIVPTPNLQLAAPLPERERAIYELVARRYLMQFFPAFSYLQTRAVLAIASETFVARGRRMIDEGWRTVASTAPEERFTDDVSEEPNPTEPLTALTLGSCVTATDVAIAEKRTQPAAAFTDASLMQAMCNVARFVTAPHIKKILTEADGIGTPATRAAIIETLFERRYVTRVKKSIVSTATGRAFVRALPSVATTPDMTAVWEAAMRAISDGEQTLEAFVSRIEAQLRQLVAEGRSLGHIAVRPTAGDPTESASKSASPRERSQPRATRSPDNRGKKRPTRAGRGG